MSLRRPNPTFASVLSDVPRWTSNAPLTIVLLLFFSFFLQSLGQTCPSGFFSKPGYSPCIHNDYVHLYGVGLYDGSGTSVDELQEIDISALGVSPKKIFSFTQNLFLTTTNEIWSMGDHTNKQLCRSIGSTFDTTFSRIDTGAVGTKAVQTACAGPGYSIIALQDGTYAGCGKNNQNQLGQGATGTDQETPVSISVDGASGAAKMLSCGASSVALIDSSGEVYMWGLHNTEAIPAPVHYPLPNGEKAIKVSVGDTHVLVLSDSGDVYGMGSNADYQMGIGSTTIAEGWNKATFFSGKQISHVVTGLFSSIAYSSATNTVYGFGRNYYGQTGSWASLIYPPEEFTDLPQLRELFDFEGHSLLLTDTGLIYSSGLNENSQATGTTGWDIGQFSKYLDSGSIDGEKLAHAASGHKSTLLVQLQCHQISAAHADVCGGHGTCITTDVCECQTGYTGTECLQVMCHGVADDNSTVCNGHGNCTGIDACTCDSGFSGAECDGFTCGGVENTDPSVCSGAGSCTAPDTCDCQQGYTGTICESFICFGTGDSDNSVCGGHGTCADVDSCDCNANFFGSECEVTECYGTLSNDTNVCNSHGMCEAPDSCNCTAGYSGSQCSITDCGGVASNHPSVCNSRGTCDAQDTCSCDGDYFGDYCENSFCFGIPSTDVNVCSGHGDCVDLHNCNCSTGYSGAECEVVGCYGFWSNDTSVVCNGHGTCENVDECSCNSGYGGSECELSDCYGTWSTDPLVCNSRGSCDAPDSCSCDEGYSGNQCEGFGCFGVLHSDPGACSGHGSCESYDQCDCDVNYYGSSCDVYDCFGTAKNDSTVCNSRGVCDAPDSCTCSPGYSGSQCEKFYCFGTIHNDGSVCSGRGTCEDVDQCSCDTGFAGEACNLIVCEGQLSNDTTVCSGRGACSSPNSCTCDEGYHGADCDTPECFDTFSNSSAVCSGQGTCQEYNQCSCEAGFTGLQCQMPICFGILANSSSVCSLRGTCEAPNECSCEAHYHGDECEISECFDVLGNDSSVCNGQGECVSHGKCVCKTGYAGESCDLFVCPHGFLSNETAKVCSGNGECTGPEMCSCDDVFVGYDCSQTYYLCYGVPYNDSQACSQHGECIISDTCKCDEGFAGDMCNIPVCFGELANETSTCSSHGSCDDKDTCLCDPGFYGENCDVVTCNGVLSNDSSVCSSNGACQSPGDCLCSEGYTGEKCDVPICFGNLANETSCSDHGSCIAHDSCVCLEGYHGDNCDISTCGGVRSNDTNVCSGQGTCSSSGICQCQEGYIGELCDVPLCFGILGNESNVCAGYGTCSSYNTCSCEDGHFGEHCNISSCGGVLSNDTSNTCSGQGVCDLSGFCDCNEGYTGELCNVPVCFGILGNESSVACSGHGACSYHNNCDCSDGYFGFACDVTTCGGILSNDSTNSCSGHGLCSEEDNCECHFGYTGSLCEDPLCFGEGPSSNSSCNGHGSCVGRDICICHTNFFGEFCNVTSCGGVLSNDTSNACSGQGTCVGTNQCECLSGYTGEECEWPSCFGVPSNNSAVCNGHGSCEDLDYCQCTGDYFGQNCELFSCFGQQFDSALVCSEHGVCSFPDQCDCSEHYSGPQCSIPDCVDSSVSCSSHGSCDSVTFECVCDDGYISTNCSVFTCGGKNASDSQSCSSHGTCIALDQCSCNSGFSGDLCEKALCGGLEEDDASVCSGHGSCIQPSLCECDSGYTSSNCSVPICFGEDANSDSVCSSRGTCLDANYCLCTDHAMGANCSECMVGWSGSSCSIQQDHVPVMDYSGVISKCEALRIDASQSYTLRHDGDVEVFQWEILSSPDKENLTRFLKNYTSSNLYIPNDEVSIGVHRIGLRVGVSQSSLSELSVATITKLNHSVASSSIIGPSIRYTFASDYFALKGLLYAPCGGVEAAPVQWKQVSGTLIPISMFYQEGQDLVFPSGFLRNEASYAFQFSVDSQGVKSIQTVQVNVLMRDLIAQLNDTSRSVLKEQHLFLSANSSIDPEASPSPPQYNLTCIYIASGKPCVNTDIVEYATGGWKIVPRLNMRLSLVFSKDSRFSEPYSIDYIVQDAPAEGVFVPSVRIDTFRKKINRNNRLVLTGHLESLTENEETTVHWSCSDDSLLVDENLSSSTTSLTLIVKPNTLTQNVTRFTLTAIHSSGGTSYTFVDIVLNSPPVSKNIDSFEIFPQSGTVLNTQFTVVFRSWRDSDLPLSYRLTYKNVETGQEKIIQSYTPSNTFQFQVPQQGCSSDDYNLEIRGYVMDSLGAVTYVDTTIQVLPINFADAQDWLSFALEYLTEDFSPPPLKLLAIESSWINVISNVADMVCANCSSVALHGEGACYEGDTCIANQLYDLSDYQVFQLRALSHLLHRLESPQEDELKKVLNSVECMSNTNVFTKEFLHLTAGVIQKLGTSVEIPSSNIGQVVSILSSITHGIFNTLEGTDVRSIYNIVLDAFEKVQHQHIRHAIAGEHLNPVLTEYFRYSPVKDHALSFKELTKIRQKRVQLSIPLTIIDSDAYLEVSPSITTYFDMYEPLSGVFTFFARSPYYDQENMQDALSNTFRYEILSNNASRIVIDELPEKMRIHMPVFSTRSEFTTSCKNYNSQRGEWLDDCVYEFNEDLGLGQCHCPLTSLSGVGIFSGSPIEMKKSPTDQAYVWIIGVFSLLAPLIIICVLCCVFCGLACMLRRRRKRHRVQAQSMVTQRFSTAVLTLTSMRHSDEENNQQEAEQIVQTGMRLKKDDMIEGAYQHFIRASELGSKKAHIELGKMYMEGYDTIVPQDFTVAEHYFQLADEPVGDYVSTLDPILQEKWNDLREDNPDALVEIGKKYLQGKDLTYSAMTGRMYLEKAAALDDPRAINILAKMYREGVGGVDQSIGKCLELYHRSAELGNVEAMFNLGVLYASNKFGVKDYDDALKWMTLAKSHGVKKAPQRVRLIKFEIEFENMWKRANQDDSEAIATLASWYLKGKVSDEEPSEVLLGPDPTQAVDLLKEGCKLKNVDCTIQLANLHRQGFHVKKSYRRAVHLYKKCLPSPIAAFNLALMYERGLPRYDFEKALSLYWHAYNGGVIEAKQGIDRARAEKYRIYLLNRRIFKPFLVSKREMSMGDSGAAMRQKKYFPSSTSSSQRKGNIVQPKEFHNYDHQIE
uniref:Uncharacterized protein n=1 Tax=Percolomonas cosmopolitus TaxID=63605 RepID=A0A7S1KM39_9EUKA|mmetsp:Transcript_11077/g.41338  ORF Transcript_11077/g.41338 Transcript_11077/m.41338 type:complete len:3128 (+) Transcript_11077:529-9912(+)